MNSFKKVMILTWLVLFSAVALAQEKVRILDFLMDEVEICDKSEACRDVDRSKLPDPTKVPLAVKRFDEGQGMVMFEHNGLEHWIHQSEVKLNVTALSTVICTTQDVSRKSDAQTFGIHGLGEGC